VPFKLGRRLTGHVRHRTKYVDIPVPEHLAFVFTDGGQTTARIAHTLRELVAILPDVPAKDFEGHLERGDLSRWIREVFADRKLAADVETLETLREYEARSDVREAIVRLVDDRYLSSQAPI
jgi:hypothetical protein